MKGVEKHRYCGDCRQLTPKARGCEKCRYKCVVCRHWKFWDNGGHPYQGCDECFVKNKIDEAA